jgi:hypothetical protein
MSTHDHSKAIGIAAGAAASAYLLYKLVLQGSGKASEAVDQSNRSTTSSSGGGPTAYETQRVSAPRSALIFAAFEAY